MMEDVRTVISSQLAVDLSKVRHSPKFHFHPQQRGLTWWVDRSNVVLSD